MVGQPKKEDEVEHARCRQERARLKKENRRLRRKWGATVRSGALLARIALLVVVGPGLTTSIQSYLEEATSDLPFPPTETAQVIAAVAARLTRVGLIALVLGVLPMALLGWQNWLLSEQNARFDRESRRQAERDYISRRAALIAEIYTGTSLRSRVEATRAFQALEKPRLPRDLSSFSTHRRADGTTYKIATGSAGTHDGINLAEIEIEGTRDLGMHLAFERANLKGASLSRSSVSFRACHLDNVNLEGAFVGEITHCGGSNIVLRDAVMIGADIRHAIISGDFRGVDMQNATLDSVHFQFSDFSGANLRSTKCRHVTTFRIRTSSTTQMSASCAEAFLTSR